MFASTLFSRISYFYERRSCKCISVLNFSTLSSVRISVSSYVWEELPGRLGVDSSPMASYKHQVFVLISNIAKMLGI